MLTIKAIKGVIRGGKIEPVEKLEAPEGTEVVISVPVEEKRPPGKMMTFGMFAGPRQTTEEDFKLAEWHGEEEDWDAK